MYLPNLRMLVRMIMTGMRPSMCNNNVLLVEGLCWPFPNNAFAFLKKALMLGDGPIEGGIWLTVSCTAINDK